LEYYINIHFSFLDYVISGNSMEGERGPCHRYNRVGAVNKKILWWHDAVRKTILVFL